MEGSMDSLDFCPEIPVTEKNAIPLDCWHEISLSDIWIPSHLLPNRSKPSSMKVPCGIYHTLEKKDSSKYAKSFSVYSFDSTDIGQGDIFISDSDDDIFGSDSTSFEKIQVSDNTLQAVSNHMCPVNSVCSNDLRNSTEANHSIVETDDFEGRLNKNIDSVSLKDILDDTPQINMKDLVFDLKKKDDPFLLSLYDKKEKKVKKNKKDKAKKKTYLVLDNFLDTNIETNQDYYCDKYFQSILNDKQKDVSCNNVHVGSNVEFPCLENNEHRFTQSDKIEKEASCSNVHVGSNMELPYLASDEHIFTQSDKREKENIESTFSDLECGLIKSEEINENIIDVTEIKPDITDATCRKVVIENIPCDTTKDDILAILCGYGEIKKFSLVSTGNFFTAYVEIDLICDIDWIIECLNGSEPFGASTEKIYCYKQ